MVHRAPGKHYRNSLSLVDVMRKFPDDSAAAARIVQQRWPEGSAALAATATPSSQCEASTSGGPVHK